MNGSQDGGDVVGWRPPVLEDVEAELPVGVHVRAANEDPSSAIRQVRSQNTGAEVYLLEHFGEELDGGRLVGVGFVKGEN